MYFIGEITMYGRGTEIDLYSTESGNSIREDGEQKKMFKRQSSGLKIQTQIMQDMH